jgi:hypothetical protein
MTAILCTLAADVFNAVCERLCSYHYGLFNDAFNIDTTDFVTYEAYMYNENSYRLH